MQRQAHILILVYEIMIKTLDLRLVTMQGYQNMKMFLQNVTLPIGLKKSL